MYPKRLVSAKYTVFKFSLSPRTTPYSLLPSSNSSRTKRRAIHLVFFFLHRFRCVFETFQLCTNFICIINNRYPYSPTSRFRINQCRLQVSASGIKTSTRVDPNGSSISHFFYFLIAELNSK